MNWERLKLKFIQYDPPFGLNRSLADNAVPECVKSNFGQIHKTRI